MIRPDQHPCEPQTGTALTAGPDVLAAVSRAIGRLSYGVVQLTVHDGKVVQLDVTERQRFNR
jgi:hypothetical protein